MLKNIRSLDTLASPEKAEYCIYETPTANDSKLEESSDEKKPDKVNDSGFSYILQTIFTLMWALLIFRKLQECADAEGNAGQIYSENNKKVSLILQGLVRIKVVSWPGFPRKAEPQKGFPQELFGDWFQRAVKVTQSCPTLCDPMDYTVHGILQAKMLEWVAFPFFLIQGSNWGLPGGIYPTQGLNPGLMHCRQIFYQLSHKWNTRILKWVAYPFFLTQGSNWGLLHCRQILYHQDYEGSPSESNSRGQSEQNREEYACKLATTMRAHPQSWKFFWGVLWSASHRGKWKGKASIHQCPHPTGREWPWGVDCPALLVCVCRSAV